MQRTGIEYLTHVWNFYTGCLNKQNGDCPVDKCWAADMAHRFHRDFTPQLHPLKLAEPFDLPNTKRRIGVCFTGDLFGKWVDCNQDIPYPPYSGSHSTLKKAVFETMKYCANDNFLFLTKCPWNLKKWDKFPDNAWVGGSVCDDDMLSNALSAFNEIEASHKWLSVEPYFEPLDLSRITFYLKEEKLDWIVVGAQTHPYVPPMIEWLERLYGFCDATHIPLFMKNNLKILMGGRLIQSYPKELEVQNG